MNRAGFTLIEIMLAVLILGIVMAVVIGVVVSTLKAQERIEEITASSELGPAMLSQIRRDLEGAFLPQADAPCFAAVDRKASDGDRDRIDFVTVGMAYGAEEEDGEAFFHSVNETGYQVLDNPKEPGVGILVRREDLFLDEEPLKGGRLTEMYDRVKSFNLSFWDGEKWVPDWANARDGNLLPAAVKIELKLLVKERGDENAVQNYMTTITFPR